MRVLVTLHEAGISLVQIQAWLGHTNTVQAATYLGMSLTGRKITSGDWRPRRDSRTIHTNRPNSHPQRPRVRRRPTSRNPL